MRGLFRTLGILTLLIDVYLLLALVAVKQMSNQYFYMVPPFGSQLARSLPDSVYLAIVLWTGLLAFGCFYSTGRENSVKI